MSVVTPTYRADIDGLRAIAVLAVLLFHAGVGAFSGGFVGVDIFFVISGYLITTIIHREVTAGTFSVTRFYERRFRRILPAAAVVIVATLVAGALLFPPHQQDGLARSAVAATLFSSNIWFYLQAGYFADPASTLPLLHTWSLAVEEQFYLAFPLVMLLIAKFGKGRFTPVLLVLTVASLVTGILVTEANASAAFYLSHTRAWELMAGSLLAVNALPAMHDQRKRELVASAGLLMLLVSIVTFSEFTVFPGFAALLPVLGTAMLIHSGANGQTVVSRCLSAGPLVFIGLISYSLYLWHWPVIVFTQYYSVVTLTPAATITMLCATFAVAVVSWRYVETPFRRKRWASEPHQMLRVSAAATVALVAIGIFAVPGQATDTQQGRDVALQYGESDPDWQRWTACEKQSRTLDSEDGPCTLGTGGTTPKFMLWGDSHAMSLASSVDRSALQNGLTGAMAVASGCPPLSGVVRQDRRHCDTFNDSVLAYLAAHEEITTVILAARWTYIVSGDHRREQADPLALVDLQDAAASDTGNSNLFESGLRRTLTRLQALDKNVVLVGHVPEVQYDVPSATFIAAKTGRDVDSLIAPKVAEHTARHAAVTAIFDALREDTTVSAFVDPARYLCDRDYCRVAVDDVPLYRDDNHLSTFGAVYLANMFDDVLRTSAQRPAAAAPDLLQSSAVQP